MLLMSNKENHLNLTTDGTENSTGRATGSPVISRMYNCRTYTAFGYPEEENLNEGARPGCIKRSFAIYCNATKKELETVQWKKPRK